MWEMKEEKKDLFKKIRNTFYAEVLDKSTVYTCQVLNGFRCTTLIAKGILSIYYDIPIANEQMNKLLEEHFTKVN